jgi:hypothetical protein
MRLPTLLRAVCMVLAAAVSGGVNAIVTFNGQVADTLIGPVTLPENIVNG